MVRLQLYSSQQASLPADFERGAKFELEAKWMPDVDIQLETAIRWSRRRLG